jgi:hypothetical protein
MTARDPSPSTKTAHMPCPPHRNTSASADGHGCRLHPPSPPKATPASSQHRSQPQHRSQCLQLI